MGKKSFILGALAASAAIVEAVAHESTTTTTYIHPTNTHHTYVQGAPMTASRVVYTSAPRHSGGTTAIARDAYGKIVRIYDVLDSGDIVEIAQDVGLELVSIWRRGETIRVSLSHAERDAVEAVITAFGLPVTNPSKLSAAFAKAVRYI